MTILDTLTPSPADAPMRAARLFAADTRPEKINLGIGMYYDDTGRIPILRSVQAADKRLRVPPKAWAYLQPEGLASLRHGAAALCFGEDLAWRDRIATVQTLGGTGAIRLGAELIETMSPHCVVAVSRPSWPNHEAVFRDVGARVVEYTYFDRVSGGLDFGGMLADIERLDAGSVVVLHGCCHNPTGVDLTVGQWSELADMLARRELIPFVDLAYQGFGAGLTEDSASVRLLAERCCPVFVAISFSKSFSLYGERVGALCVVAETSRQAELLDERARRIIRVLNSSPPTHGASLVGEILGDQTLRDDWEMELSTMRERVGTMRTSLVERLQSGNPPRDFAFIGHQRGLFSYSGLSVQQVDALRDNHAIHAVDDGRLCIAAINTGNLARVAESIRAVCFRN